jgi:hypothetical protein
MRLCVVKIILLDEVKQLLTGVKLNRSQLTELTAVITECDSIQMNYHEENVFVEIHTELKLLLPANILETFFKKINKFFSKKYLYEFDNYWTTGNYKLAIKTIEKHQQYTILNKYFSQFIKAQELIKKYKIESIYLSLASLSYYYLINDYKTLKQEYYKILKKMDAGYYRKNKENDENRLFLLKLYEIVTSNEYQLDADLILVQRSISYRLKLINKEQIIELILLSDNQDEIKQVARTYNPRVKSDTIASTFEIQKISEEKKLNENNVNLRKIIKYERKNIKSNIKIKSYENIRIIKDVIAQLMMVADYEAVISLIKKNENYAEELMFEKMEALKALGRNDLNEKYS